jgi:DNA-binding MarR family transcriptional regulator
MPKDKAKVAAEAWKRMFDFIVRTSPQRSKVLSRMALTPNDSRALGALHATHGRTMRSLADEWGCDASNATWIVDRLEKRGFAERRSKPGDRRVKLVVLTPAGERAHQKLFDGMYDPPPELLAFPRARLEALRKALPAGVADGNPLPPSSSQRRRRT